MFSLLDGRAHFYQWDINQKIVVSDSSIKEVHFCNKTENCALVVKVYEQDGARLANVPNVLLQSDWRIKVYAYTGEYTKVDGCFKVISKSKPSDYVYTEVEIERFEKLEARMDKIENDLGESIKEGIDKYFLENPIETGATEEEAAQIKTNKQDILDIKTDIEELSADIPVKVSELENDKGYLTEHQDLSSYALKEELPSVEGLASEQYVNNAIAAIPKQDLTQYAKVEDLPTKVSELENDNNYLTSIPSEYVTDTELNSKGFLTEHQDLSAYAKASDIPKVDSALSSTSVNTVQNKVINSALDKKANDFTLEIYNGTGGNPKPVRFASFNYSTCNSEEGISAKISLVSGHGNGSTYAFLEDTIIRVNYLGNVSVDNFKYYGASASTYDGVARQYGDIFWVHDSVNKIVDFYVLMGQYARAYQVPWKRLTYSSKGSVTQYTTCTVYSSGDKEWANNNEIATKNNIPTNTETWVFTLEDGSTVTKAVYVK